ncbi:MAG: hypothetical protein Kow0069_01150 [Promethearchaeota archaeon]
MLQASTNETAMFVVALVVATLLLWLFMYLATRAIVSKPFATDKKLVLLLCAFLIVLLVPVVSGAIGTVLGAIGNLIGDARETFGADLRVNYLVALVPIIAFLLILLLVKLLVSVDLWDKALWIALLALFLLYLFYTILPEIPRYLGYNAFF